MIVIPTEQATAESFYTMLRNYASDEALDKSGLVKALLKFFELDTIRPRWTTVPASTALRFHHAYSGGLLAHSMEVWRIMNQAADNLGMPLVSPVKGWKFAPGEGAFVSVASALAAAFLHDLNKLGDVAGNARYVPNFLKSGARSDKIPYETSPQVGQFTKWAHPPTNSPRQLAEERASRFLAEEAFDGLADGLHSLALVYALSPELYDLLTDDVKFAIKHHDGAYGKARRDLNGNESPLQMLLHFADMWSSRSGQWGAA